jgi:hypothetical protein
MKPCGLEIILQTGALKKHDRILQIRSWRVRVQEVEVWVGGVKRGQTHGQSIQHPFVYFNLT